uniref:Auxin-responsive protein n=1 Tax=Oryza punctata TaxID=4537 RepID=A0A0E0M6W9_ORYPU
MLVGDVPWKMFVGTCQRLRLMKSSEAHQEPLNETFPVLVTSWIERKLKLCLVDVRPCEI